MYINKCYTWSKILYYHDVNLTKRWITCKGLHVFFHVWLRCWWQLAIHQGNMMVLHLVFVTWWYVCMYNVFVWGMRYCTMLGDNLILCCSQIVNSQTVHLVSYLCILSCIICQLSFQYSPNLCLNFVSESLFSF